MHKRKRKKSSKTDLRKAGHKNNKEGNREHEQGERVWPDMSGTKKRQRRSEQRVKRLLLLLGIIGELAVIEIVIDGVPALTILVGSFCFVAVIVTGTVIRLAERFGGGSGDSGGGGGDCGGGCGGGGDGG
ncbi:MAG: hypothetical protein CMJ75_07880 [Planctomycetaceae bacterium]|nr:hypothetical protein [Planctomycetaceae bacterium]